MDDKAINSEVMKLCSRKFGSHQKLKSKYIQKVPPTADREYIRLINQYMLILKKALEEELPKLKSEYRSERNAKVKENLRNDGEDDLAFFVDDLFRRLSNMLQEETDRFDLIGKLKALANIDRRLSIGEWKKAVKATLGIDIREDYYMGDFFQQILDQWVSENVDLIQSIPQNTLGRMKEIVYEGYAAGKTSTEMTKAIQHVYGIGKRKARFIALDQSAKLHASITKAQQEDAGVEEYMWSDSGDERVRRSHRELNGKIFRWDDPPTNSDGRTCHPGQDYGCRCVAVAVFDRNTITLPIESRQQEYTDIYNTMANRGRSNVA